MIKNIEEHCATILQNLSKDKPWMTSNGLMRRIKKDLGKDYDEQVIEDSLIEHSENPNRVIRHSHYPSKRTLALLWGHTAVVGEKQNLAEITRIDEPIHHQGNGSDEGKPWFFVSHNYRDLSSAVKLRNTLNSYGIGAWLFETEIPQGGQIAEFVQKAIGECVFFISYVTSRSIGSLWVQKEFFVAKGCSRCKSIVVLDGSDQDLLRIFETWTGAWPPEKNKSESS